MNERSMGILSGASRKDRSRQAESRALQQRQLFIFGRFFILLLFLWYLFSAETQMSSHCMSLQCPEDFVRSSPSVQNSVYLTTNRLLSSTPTTRPSLPTRQILIFTASGKATTDAEHYHFVLCCSSDLSASVIGAALPFFPIYIQSDKGFTDALHNTL
jgi:hypothetical protein